MYPYHKDIICWYLLFLFNDVSQSKLKRQLSTEEGLGLKRLLLKHFFYLGLTLLLFTTFELFTVPCSNWSFWITNIYLFQVSHQAKVRKMLLENKSRDYFIIQYTFLIILFPLFSWAIMLTTRPKVVSFNPRKIDHSFSCLKLPYLKLLIVYKIILLYDTYLCKSLFLSLPEIVIIGHFKFAFLHVHVWKWVLLCDFS